MVELSRRTVLGAAAGVGLGLAMPGHAVAVIYHCNKEAGGSMLITEVGNGFTLRRHLGVFHSPLPGAPDNGRCAAPSFGNDLGVEYFVYEAGERLSGSIAIAKAQQRGAQYGSRTP